MLQISVQLCLRLHISTINKTPIYPAKQTNATESFSRPLSQRRKGLFGFYSMALYILLFPLYYTYSRKKTQKSLDNIGEKQRKEQQQTVL